MTQININFGNYLNLDDGTIYDMQNIDNPNDILHGKK